MGPTNIEDALGNVNIAKWWDAVGGSARLQETLGTDGARATGKRARERLEELWKWRNHLAHGGDDEPSLSESEISDAIKFVEYFGAALDGAVEK